MPQIEVTEELLTDYCSMREELVETRYKLEHFADGDKMIGNDVIFDYSTGYPMPQSVVGYDYKRADHLKTMYANRIRKIEEQMHLVECYIDSIGSSVARRVMDMYYLQGMSQKSIAMTMRKSQPMISCIIKTELDKLH